MPGIGGVGFAHQGSFALLLGRIALAVGVQRAGQLAVNLAQYGVGVFLLLTGLDLGWRGFFLFSFGLRRRLLRLVLRLFGLHRFVQALVAGAHHGFKRVE